MTKKVKIFHSRQEAFRVVPEGEKRLVHIGEKRICLIRRRDVFTAVDDSCPHLGHSLTKGTLNPQGEIICPWHSYRFDLATGEESERRCKDLKIHKTSWQDGLYIELD